MLAKYIGSLFMFSFGHTEHNIKSKLQVTINGMANWNRMERVDEFGYSILWLFY